jgi:hypothetical protein
MAGLVIAAVAAKEGREAWRGEGCCGPLGTMHNDEHACGCGDAGCSDGCCAATDKAAPVAQQIIQIEGLQGPNPHQ